MRKNLENKDVISNPRAGVHCSLLSFFYIQCPNQCRCRLRTDHLGCLLVPHRRHGEAHATDMWVMIFEAKRLSDWLTFFDEHLHLWSGWRPLKLFVSSRILPIELNYCKINNTMYMTFALPVNIKTEEIHELILLRELPNGGQGGLKNFTSSSWLVI